MKSYIIVIEGSDGSGRETQTKELVAKLKKEKYNVLSHSFPSKESPSAGPARMFLEGELGESDTCLDPYQASVLFATDRLCSMKKFEKHLSEGGILVLDKYVSGNKIRQGPKFENPKERAKFFEWVEDFEYGTLKLPEPDLVFYLDVPSFVSKDIIEKKRLKKGKTVQEVADIHEKTLKNIDKMNEVGRMLAEKSHWELIRCVNAQGERLPIADIHKQIYEEVSKLISK